MATVANVATGIVAALHAYFLVLEMFLWTKPHGRRVFNLTPAQAAATRSLATNQGLYNGFLATGLVWSLLPGPHAHAVRVFFLSCVILAGIVGAITAHRKILWVQALPGLIALGLSL